jgi:hypothetical protein
VEVTLKESACPVSTELHCQIAPQFLVMVIHPVLVPLTDIDWMEPLPATLVTSTSWKYFDPRMLNLIPPCLQHLTLQIERAG